MEDDSERNTDDEGDEPGIVLLQRPNSTIHVRIPPKCYIYVMTTTGRQNWMLPGVYVGTYSTQFGEDGLSECHVGMCFPDSCHPPESRFRVCLCAICVPRTIRVSASDPVLPRPPGDTHTVHCPGARPIDRIPGV